MYSFDGIINPDNIHDTSKLDYEYTYINNTEICQICGLKIYNGVCSCYTHLQDEYIICGSCYSNLRCPETCRTCNEDFESRNELFRHLETSGHATDPLIYNFDNGNCIEFVCKRDYDIFTSNSGSINECDDYNTIDYNSILNSQFYKIKNYRVKFCVISQHSSLVIPKINNISSKQRDGYINISFNWGEHELLLDVAKNIGWIEYRRRYVIPISSIILIV